LRFLYITVLGLPITAYAIWYVLQVAPMRQVSKMNKVLGLLFFGIVGMWMIFPSIYKIQKQLERKEAGFSVGK
jgi:putative Mn2+ efflux pump MntP